MPLSCPHYIYMYEHPHVDRGIMLHISALDITPMRSMLYVNKHSSKTSYNNGKRHVTSIFLLWRFQAVNHTPWSGQHACLWLSKAGMQQ